MNTFLTEIGYHICSNLCSIFVPRTFSTTVLIIRTILDSFKIWRFFQLEFRYKPSTVKRITDIWLDYKPQNTIWTKVFSQMFHPHVWYELKCLSDYIFEVNIPVPQFDHENEVDGLHFKIVSEIRPLWLRFDGTSVGKWLLSVKRVITVLSSQLIKNF